MAQHYKPLLTCALRLHVYCIFLTNMANVVYLSDMREPEQCLHSNNNKKQIMNMATFVTICCWEKRCSDFLQDAMYECVCVSVLECVCVCTHICVGKCVPHLKLPIPVHLSPGKAKMNVSYENISACFQHKSYSSDWLSQHIGLLL